MDLQLADLNLENAVASICFGADAVSWTVLMAGGSTRHEHRRLKDNLGWFFGIGTVKGEIYAALKQLSRHTLWSDHGNKYVHASHRIQYSFSLGLCIRVQLALPLFWTVLTHSFTDSTVFDTDLYWHLPACWNRVSTSCVCIVSNRNIVNINILALTVILDTVQEQMVADIMMYWFLVKAGIIHIQSNEMFGEQLRPISFMNWQVCVGGVQ